MLRIKLKTQLIVIFIVIFLIPILFSIKIMNDYAVRFSQESTQRLNISNMKYIGSATNQLFNSVYDFSLYLGLEKSISSYLLAPSSAENQLDLQLSAQGTLALLPFSNTFVKSVAVFRTDGQYLNSGTKKLTLNETERARADRYAGYYFWYFEREKDIPDLYFCRQLRLPSNLSNIMGYLKISVSYKELDRLFFRPESDRTDYYIMDESGELLYGTNLKNENGKTAASLSYGSLNALTGNSALLSESNCFVTPYKIDKAPWVVFSVTENQYTSALTGTLNKSFLTYTVLCFVFCLILALIFTRIIVAPLKKLGTLMEHVQNEDYSVRFHAKGNDEITVLANQFDAMSEQLQTLYTQVYQYNLKLKQAQLSALQAQINPHFLYNTLDTIYWMSEFHHTGDVSQMVSSLSTLFRICISSNNDPMVPLKTELEHVKCYMHIQQIRYQNRLSYTINVQKELENLRVMKLILQPLLENSVIHGIGAVGRGSVTVNIYERDGRLIYEVIDDSHTADADKINRLIWCGDPDRKGKVTALRNINDRIVLSYSPDYGVYCINDKKRTIFYVLLPIIRTDGENND